MTIRSVLVRQVLAALAVVSALCGFYLPKGLAAVGCLTNDEARRIWPREHLYWHTGAHCWDATSQIEYRGRSQQKIIPAISTDTLFEYVQYSRFITRSESSRPFAWIDTISWSPKPTPSFESKWHETVMELERMAPDWRPDALGVALNPPVRQASVSGIPLE
jgi:hypothetical protein